MLRSTFRRCDKITEPTRHTMSIYVRKLSKELALIEKGLNETPTRPFGRLGVNGPMAVFP